MIKEILLVHHSHTDIGYTHPQPVVLELHRRFIDEALHIADATQNYGDESRFKWTCEVTGITRDWWLASDNHRRDRFLAAVRRGQFEVAGLGWNMTPLMDHAMVLDILKPIKFFRDLGVPVRSAMNTDVNGLPWGVVDALLDHDITGVSMAINEHFGHALKPWPRAFRWQSPGGRTILAYNGFVYGVTSELLSVPVNLELAQAKVPAWTELWERRGYPHDFLMMQITNLGYHDNGPPQPALPDFIQRFNDTNPSVRLRFATISEFFDRMRAEPEERLPLMRGDWTDWWNFGAGSTAHETSQALRGQRDLDVALSLQAWRETADPRYQTNLNQARQALALYCEHTWGADRSVWHRQSPETRTQLLMKLVKAAEGASIARMLRRDGLEALASEAGGEEPHVLVYNPHPIAVKQSLRLPYLPPLAGAPEPQSLLGFEDEIPHGPKSHLVHRQDVHFSDLPDERAYWSEPLEVPPLSYVTVRAEELLPGTGRLTAADGRLSNGVLDVELDIETGGLKSLKRDGVDFAGPAFEGFGFGVPILERVGSGNRDAVFEPLDGNIADKSEGWHRNWTADRSAGRIVEQAAIAERGRAELSQTFLFETGDRVQVIYRLVTDSPSLELNIVVDKQPFASPHAIYLPLPTALRNGWECDFETGGAAVRLDIEQLRYASRHYITAQRWLRIADGTNELTVACPDVPLWQIGGFTFGHFEDPDGHVERSAPILMAWLTNNYWSTNFRADQHGQLRFQLILQPGPRRTLGAAAQTAVMHANPLAVHIYAKRGSSRQPSATLLHIEAGDLLLSRSELLEDGAVALTLLNPGTEAQSVVIRPGIVRPVHAVRTSLSGSRVETLDVVAGTVKMEVRAREWTRIAIALQH